MDAQETPRLNRSDAVRVRLNRVEKEAFDAFAKDIDVKPSQIIRRLIREMINGGPEYFDDGLQELRTSHRELAAVGRNLNQLVKMANRGEQLYSHEVAEELHSVKAQVANLELLYRKSVERVRQRSVIRSEKKGRAA